MRDVEFLFLISTWQCVFLNLFGCSCSSVPIANCVYLKFKIDSIRVLHVYHHDYVFSHSSRCVIIEFTGKNIHASTVEGVATSGP